MIACINDITLDWSILEIASWMYPVWSQTESGAFSFQAARPDPVTVFYSTFSTRQIACFNLDISPLGIYTVAVPVQPGKKTRFDEDKTLEFRLLQCKHHEFHLTIVFVIKLVAFQILCQPVVKYKSQCWFPLYLPAMGLMFHSWGIPFCLHQLGTDQTVPEMGH